jgi:SdrD B-like protein/SprB-like repeat protein/type IX secretion system substrate protein
LANYKTPLRPAISKIYVLKKITMRLIHQPMHCLNGAYSIPNSRKKNLWAFSGRKAFLLILPLFWSFSAQALTEPGPAKTLYDANGEPYSIRLTCDNVINGGWIESDEFGCPNPEWDPGLITNVSLPTGGTGNLEFIWIFSTDDPNQPYAQWTPIPNTNSPEYDPAPTSITTYFRRCARRAGCTDYVGESNIVMKEAICCDNLTDGGEIGFNQSNCTAPFNPGFLENVTLPSGGTGALEYQWVASVTGTPYSTSNPDWAAIPGADSVVYDPDSIMVNTWFIRLSRRHGCTDYAGVSNMVLISIQSTVFIDSLNYLSPTCLNASDASIHVTFNGGDPPYQFDWSPNVGNVQNPVNIAAGTYYVTMTDVNGCSASDSITVAPGPTLGLSLESAAESCLGANNGSASVANVSGGQPAYSYLWSDPLGQPASAISGLAPGQYFVTVTDVNGCSASDSITVASGAALGLSLESTAESCLGANNGSASVANVSGGQPAYSYQWSDPFGQTASSITNLAPGQYFVTVTDGNGCEGADSIQVDFGLSLQISTTATPVFCFNGSGGTASVTTVSGGTAPYNYVWSDPDLQTTETAVNLPTGTYTVIVTDTVGCVGTDSVAVENTTALTLTLSAISPVCPGGTGGTATVAAAGGTGPYAYLWSDSLGQTSETAINLAASIYFVTVTDGNGCTITGSVAVDAVAPLEFSVASTDASCFGGDDGSATVSFVNDDPNSFTYLWDDPAQSISPTAANLAAGTYNVTVTDSPGCAATGTALVNEAPGLIAMFTSDSASCAGASDGTASVIVSGGTPFNNGEYQYLWDVPGNPMVSVLDDVAPGQYSVTVTDANSCTITGSVGIGAPAAIVIDLALAPISCAGNADGGLTANVQGGVAPYAYQWDDPGQSTGAAITGLNQGTYSVTVTDANGCAGIGIAQIFEPPILSLAIGKQDVVCENDSTGSALALAAGGTAPYTYAWNTGDVTAQITGLATGSYDLTVTDAHGCLVSTSFEIIFTSDLVLSVTAQDANCFDGNDGSATANGTGGALPYNFVWNNGGTGSTMTSLSPGTYAVTLTDADGCMLVDSAVAGSPPLLNCQTQLVAAVSYYGGNDGIATVTASGGTGQYSFLWNDATAADTVFNLYAGLHSVTVSDENDCFCVSHITLTDPAKIGNFVWDDQDQDGVQDAGEPGLPNIGVQLSGTGSSGAAVNLSTLTDSSGFYAFDGLEDGFYQLSFTLPPSSLFTLKDNGDDSIDSDVDPASGQTATFALASEFYDEKWDCGIVILDEKVNIGDFIWLDQNQNGIQDVNEFGLEAITVRLKSVPGNATVATKVTDLLGHYLFENVAPGAYVVEIPLTSLPNGYVLSPQDQGSDDTTDSDMDIVSGQTAPFQVLPYTLDILTIDGGIFKECDNVTDGGLVGYNEDLCGFGADPAVIVNITSPTGGYGNIEYLWLQSNVPVFNGPGDPNWSMIPNSNVPEYDPGPINISTYYIRCARREGCGNYPGESNIVAKSITPNPLTQIIDEPGQLCENENGRFEAAIAGGGATYFWEFGGDATPQSSGSRVVNAVSWATQGVKNVKLTVTRFGCSYSVSTTVVITGCTSPLIVVKDLNAVVNGDQINLRWNSSGDLLDVVFFIQRSEDGTSFENLAALSQANELPGGGYEFTDLNPLFGENNYRIKYKKLTGGEQEGFSEITTAYYQPAGIGLVHVYPNPTSGALTLELLKPSDEPVLVQISNAFGEVLKTVECPPLEQKQRFDIGDLPAGIYLLTVKQEGYREFVRKIVKTE